MKINWVHFPLHPETPAQGISLEELFAGRDIDLDAMYARMKALMDDEGLPYGQRSQTYNSRLAQELAKWADTQVADERIHAALYKAYFVDNQNIGDIDVLLAIIDDLGLSKAKATEVLIKRTFQPAVDADWQKSRQYGVTGVPTFVAGGYGVVGAQPYEALEQLITQALTKVQ